MTPAPDDAHRQVQQFRRRAVPLQATRRTREGIPILVLNTAGRPDIADLFRVQAQVGVGEATSTWHFAYLHAQQLRCAWLVVAITDPVAVELVIEFNLDDAHTAAIIDAAEQSGNLWLINHADWRARAPVAGILIATPPLPV